MNVDNAVVTINGNVVKPSHLIVDKSFDTFEYEKLYCYKGVSFYYNPFFGGLIVLSRDGKRERKWRNVSRRQWRLIAKFSRLPKEEQEKYLLSV